MKVRHEGVTYRLVIYTIRRHQLIIRTKTRIYVEHVTPCSWPPALPSVCPLCCQPPAGFSSKCILRGIRVSDQRYRRFTTLLTSTDATDYCSSALALGGPKVTLDRSVAIGLNSASESPAPGSSGSMVKDLTDIIGFLSPPNASGLSIYNCISGFADGGPREDSTLDVAQLKAINQAIDVIKRDILAFEEAFNEKILLVRAAYCIIVLFIFII